MPDNHFWIRFWLCICAVAIAGIGTIGGCVAYESTLVSKAIEKGADPIAARCAMMMGANSQANPICAVKAAQTK